MRNAGTLSLPGYQVMQFLGTGARSTIWQVRETQTGKLFALKRTLKRERNDFRYLEQAIQEYQIGSQLNHPSLRKVFWMRRARSLTLSVREVCTLLEYCEGRTVQESPPESLVTAVGVFLQTAAALAYMNREGFVHADMKPDNIVVAPGGEVKVIDFGQSCRVGTVKERIQGTPNYIAPEQVHRRPMDARTDVYNFGATLYWTLTGRAVPSLLPNEDSVLPSSQPAVLPPDKLNEKIPPSLTKLILDCIEIHPARRPSSMNEVVSRLEMIEHTLLRNGHSKVLP